MVGLWTRKFVYFFVFFIKLTTSEDSPPGNEFISLFNVSKYKLTRNCAEKLEEFSQSASNFTLCAINNARPIHMCEHCLLHYVSFRDKYNAALNEPVNSTHGDNSTCKSMLISQDKLEVLLSFHGNIQTVWDNAHCDACYDWTHNVPSPSNSTLKFYKLFNSTKDCINKNVNPSLNNSEEVCKLCMEHYMELDKHYLSLSRGVDDLDSVCMDIIDSMNNTRIVWSKILNCCRLRRHPEIIFLVCSGIIGALPLLFYIFLRYFGTMRDLPRVLRQTRFKQTFLAALQTRRSSTSSQ